MKEVEESVGPAAKGARSIEELAQGRGRAVLSSSTGEQRSYMRKDGQMSIFTYHLIEALTGHAEPEEGAKEVLVSDVMGHVYRHVPKSADDDWGVEQTPDYQVSGNFPIALLLGGKGRGIGQPAPDPLERRADGGTAGVVRSIDTSGGAYIEGIVDISSGDFVAGDKITYTHVAPPTPTFATAPPPSAHFTGRRAELDALTRALTTGNTLQFTTALQGMGGIGKTALATQLAAELASDFPGGVFWADLPAMQGDPLPVLASWARLCGQDVSGLPDSHARAQVVRGMLVKRVAKMGRLLMILDDVREGWLDGARVLQSSRPPGVPLLLTTRDEELALALDATVHCLDVLSLQQSLDLLAALAGPAVKREPHAARWLAGRVGCLPLALELAGKLAARCARRPDWRLVKLCKQFRDCFIKVKDGVIIEELKLRGQPGLVATFSLNYDALDVDQQRLFRALGVFAPAPFAANHVAAVVGREEGTVEKSLDDLVARSLVRWERRPEEKMRYGLHPLLRDYAAALLKIEDEEQVTCAAHAAHYLAYAQAHEQRTAADYDALEAELGNLLAAMDWAYEAEEWSMVIDLTLALRHFFDVRGYWWEEKERLGHGIYASEQVGDREALAHFVMLFGVLLYNFRNFDKAEQKLRKSLKLSREIPYVLGIQWSLYNLGLLLSDRGVANLNEDRECAERHLNSALNVLQEALDIAESQDEKDLRAVINCRQQIGKCYINLEEFDHAEEVLNECLALYDEIRESSQWEMVVGDTRAYTYYFLGMLYFYRDDPSRDDLSTARERYMQSLQDNRELGDRRLLAETLVSLAEIDAKNGDWDQADKRLDEARRLGEEMRLKYLVEYIDFEFSSLFPRH
jgi:tetratricopeptide (TPR) repeat protein